MHVSFTISVHYYCLAKIILQQTITFILTILDLHQIYILIVTNQTMENFLLYIKEQKHGIIYQMIWLKKSKSYRKFKKSLKANVHHELFLNGP